jgi:hypothetical protein
MGHNRRYRESFVPETIRRAPLDLSDPVEAQIAKAQEIYDQVKFCPEKTPENWAYLIALRRVIPGLCTSLWSANKKLKEFERGNGPPATPAS